MGTGGDGNQAGIELADWDEPMLRAIWQAPYGRQEARFVTRLPLDVAVQRLAAAIKRPKWLGWFDYESAVGEASHDAVMVWRDIPLLRGRLLTVFMGSWETTNGETVLVGYYQLHPMQQRIWTYIFAIFGAFSVLVVPVLVIFADRGSNLLLLAIPPLMILFGVVFLFGPSFRREDREWIAKIIRTALDGAD